MQPLRWTLLPALNALLLALGAQDLPAPGYRLEPRPNPGGGSFAVSTTLSSGEIVAFDGVGLDLYDEAGNLVRSLGSLPGFVFPSFVVADPGETLVVLGESSTGLLYTKSLSSTSDPAPLTQLTNNFDAAFAPDSQLYVSAATCGFGCGNDIWLVHPVTGVKTLVAQVAGPSGPLACAPSGDLYYATASDLFPPPAGSSSVLRWSAAQLAAGNLLGEADAQVLGAGFTGAAQLALDPRSGALFLGENDFGTGENHIRALHGSPAQSPVILEGRPFLSLGNLDFNAAAGPARFLPHQPAAGGTLTYTTTDFGALFERYALEPRRPQIAFSGPGTSGPGPFALDLDSGPPLGFARILYGPQSQLPGQESALVLGGLPLFVGLGLGTISSLPGLVALDAQGQATVGFNNPGNLSGLFAVQLLLLDSGLHLAATSERASF